MSGQVIKFKLPAHRADRSLEISRSIFASIHQGEGRDAHVVAKDFLVEWPNLTTAELSAAFALASRVLSKFHQLILEAISGAPNDDGGNAA
jgi:hypothetical protein